VEANAPQTWDPLLLNAGYLFAFFDGVNRFYVRQEDRDLLPVLAVPANAGDNFLIHGYLARIAELECHLAELLHNRHLSADMRITTLTLAHRLDRFATRYPRLRAWLKPIARRLAG
jgi:hypothetical protein